MKYFEGWFEVWVKPLYRKARPKRIRECFAAKDYEDFLKVIRREMNDRYKRWTLLSWNETITSNFDKGLNKTS